VIWVNIEIGNTFDDYSMERNAKLKYTSSFVRVCTAEAKRGGRGLSPNCGAFLEEFLCHNLGEYACRTPEPPFSALPSLMEGHHSTGRYVPWLLKRLDCWNLLARGRMPAQLFLFSGWAFTWARAGTVRDSFLGPAWWNLENTYLQISDYGNRTRLVGKKLTTRPTRHQALDVSLV